MISSGTTAPTRPPASVNPCLADPCGPFSQCRNQGGFAACSCLSGSIGVPPNCRPEATVNNISGVADRFGGVDLRTSPPFDPKTSSGCVTVGGGTTGDACVFPFIFNNKKHNRCTLEGADDGIPWCSTQTDRNGVHVGGQGKWGHCPDSCGPINGIT